LLITGSPTTFWKKWTTNRSDIRESVGIEFRRIDCVEILAEVVDS
jgi:hypothetical protein